MDTHLDIAARWDEEGYHHGPAPLGFGTDDGHLIEGEHYHQVVVCLGGGPEGGTVRSRALAHWTIHREPIISIEDPTIPAESRNEPHATQTSPQV